MSFLSNSQLRIFRIIFLDFISHTFTQNARLSTATPTLRPYVYYKKWRGVETFSFLYTLSNLYDHVRQNSSKNIDSRSLCL